jgi:hypothetical protein
MIYSRIIETGRGFENQMIGSGQKLFYSASGMSSDFLFGGFQRQATLKETGEHYA